MPTKVAQAGGRGKDREICRFAILDFGFTIYDFGFTIYDLRLGILPVLSAVVAFLPATKKKGHPMACPGWTPCL